MTASDIVMALVSDLHEEEGNTPVMVVFDDRIGQPMRIVDIDIKRRELSGDGGPLGSLVEVYLKVVP